MGKKVTIFSTIFILGVFIFLAMRFIPSQKPKPIGTLGANSSNSQNTTASTYTLSDVAKHNSESSCWSAINGNVYDLTSWINQHPGGPQNILSICGMDGSASFNAQHAYSRGAQNELSNFYIGQLKS